MTSLQYLICVTSVHGLYIVITLYMYDPCSDIWGFIYPKKSYFPKAKHERNMTSEGKQSFIYRYNKGHALFIIPKLHT